MSTTKPDTFASVWDAIADTPEEAANLRVRSDVMSKIAAIVEGKDWTQTEAARSCGVTQPRMNDLLRGRISRFSLDALVNIAAALGQRVHIELDVIREGRSGTRSTPSAPRVRRQQIRARGARVGGSKSTTPAKQRATRNG